MAASPKPPGPRFEGKWSNEKCIEIAFSDNFPAYVKDISIQKNIINRFFNFYLGGKPQKGLSVTDLAFAVISIMPLHELTEEFLWDITHYKEDGTMFFLTPEDKLRADVGHIQLDDEIDEKLLNGKVNETQIHENARFDKKDQNKFDVNDKSDNTDEKPEVQVNDNADVKETTQAKSENSTMQENKETRTYKDDQQPSTSSSKSNQEDKTIPKFPTNIKWYSRAPKKKDEAEGPLEFGPLQNSAFIASCNELLNQWDTNQKARIILKYFFGIVALILMRATTKKYTHLMNSFASNKFLSTISFTKDYFQYFIPHKKCVKNGYRTFRKRDGNMPIMFAKIVVNSFYIDAQRRNNGKGAYPKLNILKLTVLSHTANFGFGLINMLQNIEEKIGVDGLNKVIKATYGDLTAESWKRLKFFAQTYMVDSSKEATHHWGRVISNDFFKYLSCSANFELSAILGVFIEKITGTTDIWQSSWVKSVPNLVKLKKIGLDMYNRLDNSELLTPEEETLTKAFRYVPETASLEDLMQDLHNELLEDWQDNFMFDDILSNDLSQDSDVYDQIYDIYDDDRDDYCENIFM